MSDAISRLGLDVDTSGLKRANADLERFERETGKAARSATNLEGACAGVFRQMRQMLGAAVALAAAVGLAMGAGAVIRYADDWKTATNQLKLAVESAEDLKFAQDGVFSASQKTFTALSATAQLTSKIQQYAGDITGSLQATLKVTESISKAAIVGGQASSSTAAGIFQLNQALGSGVLRGAELISVMEQLPVVARAIAAGLGQPIGKLKTLGEQGVLTSEIVIKALQNQADAIDDMFAKIEPTVGQAMQKLQNSLAKLFGKGGEELFSAIAQGISDIADALASDGSIDTLAVALHGLMTAGQTLISVLPAIAAGLAAMMVSARLLPPILVAVQLGLSGATGRMLVAERAAQVMSLSFATARAATASLITALGGPLAIAIGIAATAFVMMGNQAKTTLADTLKTVDDTVNAVRVAINKMRDENSELRKQGQDDINATAEAILGQMNGLMTKRREVQKEMESLKRAVGDDTDHPMMANVAAASLEIKTLSQQIDEASARYRAFKEELNKNTELLARTKPVSDPIKLPPAVNKEAEKLAEKIAKQAADLKLAFEEVGLAAAATYAAVANGDTVAALDRQLDIIAQTDQLLSRYTEYYDKFGAQARQRATDDAKHLIAVQSETKMLREIARINADLAQLPGLKNALTISVEEFDTLRLAYDLMAEFPDLSIEQARAEAQKLRVIEDVTAELERQADRARDLAKAPAQNWLRGLEQSSDDFWTDWVNKGVDAFDDLGEALNSLWKQLQADMLRQLFEPFRKQITGSFDLMAQGAISAASQAGTTFAQTAAAGAAPAGAPPAAAGQPAGQFSIGSMQFNASSLLQQAAWAQIIYQAGQQLAGAIVDLAGKKLSPDSAQRTQDIGGLFGGLIGGAYGLLFGSQPSNEGAVATLGAAGRVSTVEGSKRTAETEAAVRGSAEAVAAGQKMLRDMGATLGATVDKLIIGTRDVSRFSLSNSAAETNIGTVGDPRDLTNKALEAVLRSAQFTNPALQSVAASMMDAGRSFEDTLDVLTQLSDVLPSMSEPLSEWAQKLKDLESTFETLRLKTEGAARATLDAAEAQAKAAIRSDFNESISDQLMQARSPLQAQLKELLKVQAQRATDSGAVGGNLSDVLALNAEELKAFITNAAGSADAFSKLNVEFAKLREQAIAAGQDVSNMDTAFGQARAQIVTSFNEATDDAMRQLANPTLASFEDLLDNQKARLAQATAIGANLTAVERLNAMETQKFFENLSDEQRRNLGDYLGIIEDFNGKIAATLQQLGDELSARIDDFDHRREELLDQASALRDLASGITDTRDSIRAKYSDLSPMAGLEELRARFGAVSADANAGNESALRALPQVADQLIELSRSLYGSTKTFRNDFDMVTSALDQAGSLTEGRASTAESQAQALLEQRDLLIGIRDALQQPDPALSFLSQQVDLLDQNNGLIAQLLDNYVDLVNRQAQQVLTDAALTTGAVNSPVVTGSSNPQPGGVVERDQTNGNGGESTGQELQAVAIDVNAAGFKAMVTEMEQQRNELRSIRGLLNAVLQNAA